MNNILLLEDLPEIRAWLKSLVLQVFPHARITECSRVQDALLQVQSLRFDLALCGISSLACVGGVASTPLLAAAYAPVLGVLHEVLQTLAADIAQLADKLLYGRTPPPVASLRPLLATLHWAETAPAESQAPSAAMLTVKPRLRSMASITVWFTGLSSTSSTLRPSP